MVAPATLIHSKYGIWQVKKPVPNVTIVMPATQTPYEYVHKAAPKPPLTWAVVPLLVLEFWVHDDDDLLIKSSSMNWLFKCFIWCVPISAHWFRATKSSETFGNLKAD